MTNHGDQRVPAPLAKPFSSRRRWGTLLGLLMPINTLLTLDRAALALLAPTFMLEFGLSVVQTTLLTSVVLWTYSAFQIPAGWAVAKFGIRAAMATGLLLWSSSMLLTPFVQGFGALLALRAILGLGQSPDWSASIASVKAMFKSTERGRASSILLSGMYLGTALGGPATAYLMFDGDWHWPLFVFGALGVAISIIWLCVFVEAPREEQVTPSGGDKVGFLASLAVLGRSSRFWAVCMSDFCLSACGSLIFIAPLFLSQKLGADIKSLAWMTAAPAASKYISVLAAGVLGDFILRRTASVWMARVPLMALGVLAAGIGAAGAAWVPGTTPTVILMCLSYVGVGFAQVTIWCSVQDLSVRHTAMFTGFANTCSNFGYATAPILIAMIVDGGHGWGVAFSLFALFGIVGAVASLVIRPDRPIDADSPQASAGR